TLRDEMPERDAHREERSDQPDDAALRELRYRRDVVRVLRENGPVESGDERRQDQNERREDRPEARTILRAAQIVEHPHERPPDRRHDGDRQDEGRSDAGEILELAHGRVSFVDEAPLKSESLNPPGSGRPRRIVPWSKRRVGRRSSGSGAQPSDGSTRLSSRIRTWAIEARGIRIVASKIRAKRRWKRTGDGMTIGCLPTVSETRETTSGNVSSSGPRTKTVSSRRRPSTTEAASTRATSSTATGRMRLVSKPTRGKRGNVCTLRLR